MLGGCNPAILAPLNSYRANPRPTAAWLSILKKEARSELRHRSGIFTSILFSIFAVITISFATFDLAISPQLSSGLLCVGLLFSAIVGLPRVILIEDEQGTSDLLRLMAKPEDVYWGKTIYNFVFMIATAALLTFLFLGFTKSGVAIPWLLIICLLGASASYAGTVTLCGALVSNATNRTALAGVLSVPLLLPLSFMAVSALRVALDMEARFDAQKGTVAGLGLLLYGAATLSLGVYLFKAVWKL